MIKVIAGPCSAESGVQIKATAKALASIVPELKSSGFELVAFRAGVWKPRTRPGNFEGAGDKALDWLSKTTLPAMTEVASPAHVEACLKAGIKHMWVGSRTVTNPFDVQQIADALKGTDVKVFVKNPINPDVELWIGAIERLAPAVGVKNISAIHRGFSFYEKSRYRNNPKWQVPIDVMQMLPQVEMFCDPSHIAGRREYLQEISQKALDLGFAGLFIESHIAPQLALSDAMQQVTPAELLTLLKSLTIKDRKAADRSVSETLEQLRTTIDSLDESLLDILSQRMKVVDDIGACKRAHHITVLQPSRWEEVLRKAAEGARERNLDQSFVEELFKLIHQASIDRQ